MIDSVSIYGQETTNNIRDLIKTTEEKLKNWLQR
jgi:hypothetical protein